MGEVFKKLNFILFKRLFVCLLILSLQLEAKSAFAQSFKYQYRSARFLGRGDTGIANSKGADALFYNPAGIALSAKQFSELVVVSPQGEGSDNLKSAYDKKKEGDSQFLEYLIANKNNPFYAAAQNADAIVFKKFAIGLMQRGAINAQLSEDPSTGQPSLDFASETWNGGYVALSHDVLNGHLLFGITGKFVQKTQYNLNLTALQIDSQLRNNTLTQTLKDSERKGDAMGADFGSVLVLHKESETQIGAVVRNVGMKYSWVIPAYGIAPDDDPQQVDVGASTSFGTKRGRVKLFADYRDVLNQQNQQNIKHTHLGLEYNLEDSIIVMTGLNQGYVTYGVALNFKILRVEGGGYTEETGENPGQSPSIRYFGRISLGWLL